MLRRSGLSMSPLPLIALSGPDRLSNDLGITGGGFAMPRLSLPIEERFWQKVDKSGPNGCWLWTGARCEGYGRFCYDRKSMRAHRLAYQFVHRKQIPVGMHLDHLCRTRACVNPSHLEVVTAWENTLRTENVVAKNSRKTHCAYGHAFDDANTAISYKQGQPYRVCRACARRRAREGAGK